MSKSKRTLIFQGLLSVWLVYHVFVAALMPNAGSYPGRVLGPFIYPYAAIVGLNVSWNFFSPDPAHTMYLKFTLFNENEEVGGAGQEPRVLTLPEEKDDGVWDLGRRRDLYAMRFFLIEPKRIQAVLGPWLCRQYAPVTTIHIQHVLNSIPALDQAVFFQDRELADLSQELGFADLEYQCAQINDEVGL